MGRESAKNYGYLVHYASPYYDPVKAHEYYMKNRKLAGRRRGVTLNEEGQYHRTMIKRSIDAERNTKLSEEEKNRRDLYDDAKTSYNEQRKNAYADKYKNLQQEMEARDKEIESHTTNINNQISSLRSKMENISGMSSEDKKKAKAEIAAEIEQLKSSNAKKKQELTEAFESKSATISAEYETTAKNIDKNYADTTDKIKNDSSVNRQKIKDEYDDKYEQELDRVYADSRYTRSTSKGKSSGGSSKGAVAETTKSKTNHQLARESHKVKK